MEKIVMLGTGNGGTFNLYNTCFVIQNDKGNLLVDTGGSIEIVKRLEHIGIGLLDMKDIFITHSHTDHILGFIWMMKKLCAAYLKGKCLDKINLYCNDVVYEAVCTVARQVLPNKPFNTILDNIDFHILKDNEKVIIHGKEYTFFDIHAKGTKLFGFEVYLNNKKVICLGDETIDSSLYERVRGADYVMHEAFCLEADDLKYKASKRNHTTVKTACEIMNKLHVKNLILYHTEESYGKERKKLYTEEGERYFQGHVIVPDDYDVIEII